MDRGVLGVRVDELSGAAHLTRTPQSPGHVDSDQPDDLGIELPDCSSVQGSLPSGDQVLDIARGQKQQVGVGRRQEGVTARIGAQDGHFRGLAHACHGRGDVAGPSVMPGPLDERLSVPPGVVELGQPPQGHD